MTAMVMRRGLAVVSLAVTGILGGVAHSASAHPVPGCTGRTFPGFTVRHVHLYGSDPAVAV
ncbi:MAG: hypothetical protein HOY71_29025, partial [Nonomuraea sp.]|nr:hypothetical protein [Nonomuraea sp.]